MTPLKIVEQYAKALFEAGEETKTSDRIAQDMDKIEEIISSTPEIDTYFSNPSVPSEHLRSTIDRAFITWSCPCVVNLINILFTNGRLDCFCTIPSLYKKYYHLKEGVVNAYLESAVPIDPKTRTLIIEKLEKKISKKIRLFTRVNKKLIAGFKVVIEDKLFDCSVAHQFKQLRETMIKT